MAWCFGFLCEEMFGLVSASCTHILYTVQVSRPSGAIERAEEMEGGGREKRQEDTLSYELSMNLNLHFLAGWYKVWQFVANKK